MIIVVDTNVFIGACLGNGASCEVVERCIQGQFTPVVGTALYLEYEAVMQRKAIFRKSRLDEVERGDLLDIFLSSCRWTPIYFGWRPNLPDEGDNHLIELAVAGSAQVIVTRNLNDLTGGDLSFPGISCQTPEIFLQEVAK